MSLSDNQIAAQVDRQRARRARELRDMVRLAWALSPKRRSGLHRPRQLAAASGLSRARVYRVLDLLKKEAPFVVEGK